MGSGASQSKDETTSKPSNIFFFDEYSRLLDIHDRINELHQEGIDGIVFQISGNAYPVAKRDVAISQMESSAEFHGIHTAYVWKDYHNYANLQPSSIEEDLTQRLENLPTHTDGTTLASRRALQRSSKPYDQGDRLVPAEIIKMYQQLTHKRTYHPSGNLIAYRNIIRQHRHAAGGKYFVPVSKLKQSNDFLSLFELLVEDRITGHQVIAEVAPTLRFRNLHDKVYDSTELALQAVKSGKTYQNEVSSPDLTTK